MATDAPGPIAALIDDVLKLRIVASAFASGFTPRRTFEKMTIGKVDAPGLGNRTVRAILDSWNRGVIQYRGFIGILSPITVPSSHDRELLIGFIYCLVSDVDHGITQSTDVLRREV